MSHSHQKLFLSGSQPFRKSEVRFTIYSHFFVRMPCKMDNDVAGWWTLSSVHFVIQMTLPPLQLLTITSVFVSTPPPYGPKTAISTLQREEVHQNFIIYAPNFCRIAESVHQITTSGQIFKYRQTLQLPTVCKVPFNDWPWQARPLVTYS